MEGSSTAFCFVIVEAVSLVFATVVGSQMEIYDDFHLLGEHLKSVLPEKRIANAPDGIEVELCPEVIEDIVARVGIFAAFTKR